MAVNKPVGTPVTLPETLVMPTIAAVVAAELKPNVPPHVQAARAAPQKRDLVPSDWVLILGDGDEISGRNLATGRSFVGTMLEFNKMLRGE